MLSLIKKYEWNISMFLYSQDTPTSCLSDTNMNLIQIQSRGTLTVQKKSFSHLDALPSSYRASLARLCRRWHWWIETIFSVIRSCGKREKGWKNLWKEKSSRQPESWALQWGEFCFLALMEYRRILCGFRSLKILHATI